MNRLVKNGQLKTIFFSLIISFISCETEDVESLQDTSSIEVAMKSSIDEFLLLKPSEQTNSNFEKVFITSFENEGFSIESSDFNDYLSDVSNETNQVRSDYSTMVNEEQKAFLNQVEKLASITDYNDFLSHYKTFYDSVSLATNDTNYLDVLVVVKQIKYLESEMLEDLNANSSHDISGRVSQNDLRYSCFSTCDKGLQRSVNTAARNFVIAGGVSVLFGNLLGLGISTYLTYRSISEAQGVHRRCKKACP
ncbi:MAG: hypothetical protein GDA51_00020 [Ekhidna sp.]|nr:hypothetical protein [Ekhidna sp.]MBC6424868.1 hypothetical protein [Ekhidna sp.]